MNFQAADFGLFRDVVNRIPWEAVLKGRCILFVKNKNPEMLDILQELILKDEGKGCPTVLKVESAGEKTHVAKYIASSGTREETELWKNGQATWGDCRAVVKFCREKMRRAKSN